MPIGSRAAVWLNALNGPSGPARTKAADRLLRLNEYYFDDNKVRADERTHLVETLSCLVHDPEPIVRQCLAQLLGLLQYWNETVHRLLDELLSDTNPEVHLHSVWAAANIGQCASPLCSAISLLASSGAHEVRWRVAWALGELRCTSPDTRRALARLSEDASYLTRMHALRSFGKCTEVPDKSVESHLLAGLSDPDGSVRGAVCESIAALPWDWSAAIPRIRELALHDGPRGNLYAMLALVAHYPDCMQDPPVRAWLEANRGLWWVNDLFPDA